MKRILIFLALMAMHIYAFAAPVSESVAREKAVRFLQTKAGTASLARQAQRLGGSTSGTGGSLTAAEAGEAYRPAVRKVLETQAVNVRADVSSAIRLPVLLPVYYICRGNLMAAVNGQTGKVSVRAEKDSHYVFLPWWLKAILSVLVFA